jgi:serine/threonine-protein kinase
MSARPGDRLGKYELLAPIGMGGMAEVWRAAVRGAAGFRKDIALKMIRSQEAIQDDLLDMFVDEARLCSRLSHPAIVQTNDFGFLDGRYYLAMELVEGASLRAVQKLVRGPLSVEVAVYIAAEVAGALDYAHAVCDADGRALGLVHRDVSPSNILVSVHGEVKLADFGIAKATGRATRTEAGSLKGKILYMSPEQAWGKPLDARSDLYALGLVLYELVSGKRPLEGDNEMLTLENARAPRIEPLDPSVDAELPGIVARALRPAPQQRYARGEDMRRELLAVLSRRGGTDPAAALAALARRVPSAAVVPLPRDEASTPIGGGTILTDPPKPRGTRAPVLIGSLAAVVIAGAAAAAALRGRAAHPTELDHAALPSAGKTELPAPQLEATPTPTPSPARSPSPTPSPSPSPSPSRSPSSSPSPSRRPATLRIQVRPWAEVFVDGRSVGTTPLRPIDLSAGRHTIRASNPELGDKRAEVTLSSGESRLVELVLPQR